MRIIRFFFTILFLMSILGALVFFAGRELLLFVAAEQLRSVASGLTSIDRNKLYREQCFKKIGKTENFQNTVAATQMRFIDEKNYVIEVVCELLLQEPMSISRHTLPPFVEKQAGSSGIIFSEDVSGVTLMVLGRNKTIAQQLGKSAVAPSDGVYAVYPAATCGGFGYTCCSPEKGVASGTAAAPVLDCPTQCFSQCQLRPSVLSFVSDPLPDPVTRESVTEKNQEVSFFYVFESSKDQTIEGTIEYGDGEVEKLIGTQGEVKHTYLCREVSCSFTAVLKLKNAQTGVESLQSKLNTIYMVTQ